MNWKNITVKPLLILAFIFFGLYSVGQLQRVEFYPGIALYGIDFLIAIFFFYWLIFAKGWSQLRKSFRHFTFSTGTKLCVIALVWLVIGWALNPLGLSGGVIGALYFGRLVIYAAFTYLLATAVDWRWWMKELEATIGRYPNLIMFTLAGLMIMYFGFIQYLFIPDTRFLSALGWDDHYYRLISTLLDPAFAGILLVLTFIGVETIFVRKHRLLQTVFSVLLIVAITLTFSRSSYLALLAAGGILWWAHWWKKEQRWRMPLLLVLFAMCILLVPKPSGEGVNLLRSSTVVARHDSAIAVITTQTPIQWIIGRGLFVPKPASTTSLPVPDHARQPDMFLLTVTTGYGLVGWGIVLALLYYFRHHWQCWPSWLWASFIAILTASFFNNTLFQPFVWLWFTGIVWAAELESKRHD